MADLKVKVTDSLKATDKIYTYKRWFNGVKFFFTVKLSPPKK